MVMKKIGQGRDSVRVFLEDRPDTYTEIMNKILEVHGLNKQ